MMRKFLPVCCALLAGVTGLLLNFWRPTMFTNIEWVLGGVFPLLVAVAFGRWSGLLAGAICFCLTTQYWLHPFGWIAYGLEPFVVGHLVQHRRRSLIHASFVYWLFLGTPIATLYFTQLSYAAFPANYIALAKYPLNGLFVALIAQEISNRHLFRRLLARVGVRLPLPELKQLLVSRFSTLATLPILIFSIVSFTALDDNIARSSEKDLARQGHQLSNVLAQTFVRTTADWVHLMNRWEREGTSASQRESALRTWMEQHPGWLAVELYAHAADASFAATAVELQLNNPPPGPFAPLTLPLSDPDQRPIGQATATIDLHRFIAAELRPRLPAGRDLIVLDATRQAVALPSGFTALNLDELITPEFRGALDLPQAHFTQDRWRPDTQRRERFRAAFLTDPVTGWIIVIEEPLWTSQAEAVRLFLGALLLTFVVLTMVYLLGRATAGEITAPLHDLAQRAAALSRRELPPPQAADLPIALELKQIEADVSAAAAQLSSANRDLAVAVEERDRSHAQLHQVLERLEQTVQDRTTELRQALEAAKSADRVKGEFLGMMSHELRTPLNVMLGSVELLRSGEHGHLTAKQDHSLQTIQASGRHLLGLIDDVLDFSCDELGKLSLHLAPLDPAAFSAEILRLIEPQARRKEIRLESALGHHATSLTADPKRLRQMVLNLLSNAVKFTPVAGTVRLRLSEPGNGMLRFTVEDTGIGIPADQLEEIFVPFHQLDRALSREFDGSGLGLTLVRRLARLHRGDVSVESTPGQGSAFHLELPLDAVPSTPALTDAPASPEPAASPSRPRLLRVGSTDANDSTPRPRVLIVEDIQTNAELLHSYLRIMGCEARIAANGALGVEAAVDFQPDLILMDVQMPVMDGLEATRRIRAHPALSGRELPIIIVSALAAPSDLQNAQDAGADDYLTKPFAMSEFNEVVARHLRPVTDTPAP